MTTSPTTQREVYLALLDKAASDRYAAQGFHRSVVTGQQPTLLERTVANLASHLRHISVFFEPMVITTDLLWFDLEKCYIEIESGDLDERLGACK